MRSDPCKQAVGLLGSHCFRDVLCSDLNNKFCSTINKIKIRFCTLKQYKSYKLGTFYLDQPNFISPVAKNKNIPKDYNKIIIVALRKEILCCISFLCKKVALPNNNLCNLR